MWLRWTNTTRRASGEPAATSAMVSGTRGCGTSAIERPGSSSAEKKVPSTNAVSVGSARKSASFRSHFSHLSMSGSQSSLSVRSANQERDGVGILVAVRHAVGGDVEVGRERELDARLDFADRDVLESDEAAPGLVAPQEARHRRRAVDRNLLRPEDLAAELGETEVVADVRVRQENPVGKPAERLHLRGEVGCGVDQEALAGGRVDEAERGDGMASAGIAPGLDAQRLMAPCVRNAAVLRNAEHDRLRPGGGREPGEGEEQDEHDPLL